ncbi:Sulfoquinovose 1-dehydrogenase [Thalassocella blandensis]|nr:Sulfoquinovose 1-dehydrogenase [Thalassocella blandensis]
MTYKTIFITGVSSGFGRAIAIEACKAGHCVIGTVRSLDAKAAFESLNPDRMHGVILDVRESEKISPLVASVEATYGPVDVLINNAGYGHEGIMEESAVEDLREQFEVNVFGPVSIMKAFLPFMRVRRNGVIINITSMGGMITMPGITYYCGSKFALEGISEALGKEVAGFGVTVISVAPGSFRTEWAGRSMIRSPRSIPDYDALFDPIRSAREEKSGKQLGDPAKAAEVVLDLIQAKSPPSRLLIGSDAYNLVRQKLSSMLEDIDHWETVSKSTDG